MHFVDGVADKDKESYLKFDDGTDFAKTLGFAWDPVSGQLWFFFSFLQAICPVCNRAILRSSWVGWTCDHKIENIPSTTVQG